MKTMLSRLPAVICGLLVSLGCSVKEDRSGCPCRLVLDFSETDTEAIPYADVYVCSYEGFRSVGRVESVAFGEEYVVYVSRGGVRLNVLYGAEGNVSDDGSLEIPSGYDCPRIYTYSSYVDTDHETAFERVKVRKNHCVITVHVGDRDFPYFLDVRGDVCGYGADGSPADGSFLYAMRPDGDGVCTVVVPRQKDRSLMLDVDDGTDVLKTFALGEYVAASGYDWDAENLEDITVSLDYSLSHIMLKIEGWEKELHFDVEI